MSERWTAGLINSSRSFPCCTGLRPDRPPLSQRVKGKSLPSPWEITQDPGRWQRFAALSAGERQIVAIARGLVLSPKAVVLDEPLQGLSPQYSRIVLSKLRSIASSSAVLVVEQNARLVLEYADRGYVLRQGEIALEGDSATLQASFAEGPGH